MQLRELVPLMQTMVWPLFLGILIFIFRGWFKEVLELIRQRIEAGSELGVGPSGLTIGPIPRLPDDPSAEELIEDDGQNSVTSPDFESRSHAIQQKETEDPIETLQLVHHTKFSRIKNNRNYYSIVVSLENATPEALAQVERVVYFLHRTFKNPIRETKDAKNNFALRTAAWGEFTIRADIYFKNRANPIRLSRYLNIEV